MDPCRNSFLYNQLFLLNFFYLSLTGNDSCLLFASCCSIFQIPKLGTKLKQDSLQLSYTPRRFITHPNNSYFYIIESDHRVLGEDAAGKKVQELVSGLHRRRSPA